MEIKESYKTCQFCGNLQETDRTPIECRCNEYDKILYIGQVENCRDFVLNEKYKDDDMFYNN